MSSGLLRDAINGPKGFSTRLALTSDELASVTRLIESQWLEHIGKHAPDHVEEFREVGLARYHELAVLLDHSSVWPKRSRILPPAAVDEIRQTTLFRALEHEFGPFQISDEDEVGWEEIYWRLVRPNAPSDVGPLHADRWFWELDKMFTPDDVERVKVWVAVVTESGQNGLEVVKGSHQQDWRWHGEERFGRLKPQIDENVSQMDAELIDTKPGDAIVFHDSLLHGGVLNRATTTRVSFECTLFVPKA